MIEVWIGADIGPIGGLIAQVIELYPGNKDQLYITSGRDSLDEHGWESHHNEGHFSWNGSPTAAIDIGFNNIEPIGRAFAAWIYSAFKSDVVELIFTGQSSYYIKDGRTLSTYGYATNEAHRNHVHLAMSRASATHVLTTLGTPPPDLTPEEEVHFQVLIWRIEAMVNGRAAVIGGPLKGELNKFLV